MRRAHGGGGCVSGRSPAPVLGVRALSRATLARQHLLARAPAEVGVARVIEDLVGMQAQNPRDPYPALAARLEGFTPEALEALYAAREVARLTLMRGTLHLVTARDARALRPALLPVALRALASTRFGKATRGVDEAAVAAATRALLADGAPWSRADLGKELAARFPPYPADGLALLATLLVPVVQPPPRGLWRESGAATCTPLDAWLGGEEPVAACDEAQLVLRYLGAFGPASVKDVRTWSGLTGAKEIVAGLRPRLRVFRDAGGTELFDLPDAPRPGAETPAPPRLLPEYDNVMLAHADRGRILPDGAKPEGWAASVLVDGFFAGHWRLDGAAGGDEARVEIALHRAIDAAEEEALVAEARRVLGVLAAGADHAVSVRVGALRDGPPRGF
ncbi:MAG: AlkZ family DNA glycosylase [Myxococcales bacterium]|nr:AlkZ family DNA glycosylase [Myxococcales bacterium]